MTAPDHDGPRPVCKTRYLGCMAYNDSPEHLGEPGGFVRFASDGDDGMAQMWTTFYKSQGLNDAFSRTEIPTYSQIIIGTDDDNYILFHLLVISTQRISSREAEIIEAAKDWLRDQGINWTLTPDEIAKREREIAELDVLLQGELADMQADSMTADEAQQHVKARRGRERADDRRRVAHQLAKDAAGTRSNETST